MKMKMKKMKMKNLKLLAAGLAMTASLTACGSSARETVQSADSSTETQANSAMQTENSQAQEAAPGETAEMTLILRGGSYAEVIKKALPDFEADHNCKIKDLKSSFDDLHTGIALDAVNETGTYDLCMVDGSWMAEFTENNVLANLSEMGYQFDVGPECEFFLFDQNNEGQPTTESNERAGYFDLGPVDLGENARRDMVLTLEDMGFEIEASHHEMSPAQHEIDFRYDEALKTADNIMTFKLAVKTIAKRHGMFASFMPKPKYGINGSGMHVNMSLAKDGKNIFADPEGEMGLSKEAFWFIGGIMKHMKGMTVITNPLVNSYKRLVHGYEAPTLIAWSATNRSPLIRIPVTRGAGTRVELRCPDPAANPYLVLAVCLEAGLDGIRNQITPPDAVTENVFEMQLQQRAKLGIESLPGDLEQAVEELEKDDYIKSVLGGHITEKYLEAKKAEWADYRAQVTEWEIEKYLYKI